jgi:hypothetical protein
MSAAAVHELVSELDYPMFIVTGDQWAFLLEPVEAASDARNSAFTFRRARCIDPGHEP